MQLISDLPLEKAYPAEHLLDKADESLFEVFFNIRNKNIHLVLPGEFLYQLKELLIFFSTDG